VSAGLHDANTLFLNLVKKAAPGEIGLTDSQVLERYAGLVRNILGHAVADELLRSNPGSARIRETVGPYMVGLARKLADDIRQQALDKGARRVLVLNLPDVTRMPYLSWQLGDMKPLAQGWVNIFNTTLAAEFADDAHVVVVDWHTAFNDWITHPARYSLRDVSNAAACPIAFPPHQFRPMYNLKHCTAAQLSAHPPTHERVHGADWWKGYMFVDNNYHFSPHVHVLISDLVLDALAQAGWR